MSVYYVILNRCMLVHQNAEIEVFGQHLARNFFHAQNGSCVEIPS
jgi:hypothetical protein